MTAVKTKVHAPTIDPDVLKIKSSEDINYRVVSKKTINLTTKLAYELLELPTFEGERALRESWVETLIKEAKRGAFLPDQTSVITCMCEWDGIRRRLNGQHTCWMRTFMPEDWELNVQHLVYSVPTWEDFRRLYSSIDRLASRSAGHVINARLLGTPEYGDVETAYIHAAHKGLRLYLGDASDLSPDKLSDLMSTEYLKLIRRVIQFMEDKRILAGTKAGTGHMRRAPVYAAFIATFEKAVADAEEFWTPVADGLNITTRKDPRCCIREYLIRTNIRGGAETLARDQKYATSEEVLRACLLAWNAFRRKEELIVIHTGNLARRPVVK